MNIASCDFDTEIVILYEQLFPIYKHCQSFEYDILRANDRTIRILTIDCSRCSVCFEAEMVGRFTQYLLTRSWDSLYARWRERPILGNCALNTHKGLLRSRTARRKVHSPSFPAAPFAGLLDSPCTSLGSAFRMAKWIPSRRREYSSRCHIDRYSDLRGNLWRDYRFMNQNTYAISEHRSYDSKFPVYKSPNTREIEEKSRIVDTRFFILFSRRSRAVFVRTFHRFTEIYALFE